MSISYTKGEEGGSGSIGILLLSCVPTSIFCFICFIIIISVYPKILKDEDEDKKEELEKNLTDSAIMGGVSILIVIISIVYIKYAKKSTVSRVASMPSMPSF